MDGNLYVDKILDLIKMNKHRFSEEEKLLSASAYTITNIFSLIASRELGENGVLCNASSDLSGRHDYSFQECLRSISDVKGMSLYGLYLPDMGYDDFDHQISCALENLYEEFDMTPIQFEAKYGAFSFSMLCSCCAATMFDDNYEDIITLLQQRFVFREIDKFPDTNYGRILDTLFCTICTRLSSLEATNASLTDEIIFNMLSHFGIMSHTAFDIFYAIENEDNEVTRLVDSVIGWDTGSSTILYLKKVKATLDYLSDYKGSDAGILFAKAAAFRLLECLETSSTDIEGFLNVYDYTAEISEFLYMRYCTVICDASDMALVISSTDALEDTDFDILLVLFVDLMLLVQKHIGRLYNSNIAA